MRLRKVEKVLPVEFPLLRQRITVLCEKQPDIYKTDVHHSSNDRVSFSVHGTGDQIVYLFVSANPSPDHRATHVSIESYLLPSSWPLAFTWYAVYGLFFVLFFSPWTFFQWLPIIAIGLFLVVPLFFPMIFMNDHEKQLVEQTEKMLDSIASERDDLIA